MSTLVFDADDTLLATNWSYDAATGDFLQYLYNQALPERAPSLHGVSERFYEIDAKLAAVWGVKRGRCAESMVLLYKELCNWIEKRTQEQLYRIEHEIKIREIGDRPFDYRKHTWLPGVKETLQILQAKGHTLCLLTSYDTKLFPKRAKFLGFDSFFSAGIRSIDGKKTAQDFIEVSGWHQGAPGDWYAIGNMESDIMPALDICDQWRGIYIPYRTTSPFYKRIGGEINFDALPIQHPRITNINAFKELLHHL